MNRWVGRESVERGVYAASPFGPPARLDLSDGSPSSTVKRRKRRAPRLNRSQRVAAILDGAGNFGHAIGTEWNLVFKLDRGLDGPLVIPDQAQDFSDRGVPFAERCV